MKYPNAVLKKLELSDDVLFYLSEGPIERILSNAL
ncbi:hypothetical protein M072_4429, partial [Bacteroides fragilis str. DS-208]